MTTLSDLSQGRDNNLNLIRCVAALAVLVSHAYPIALGTGSPQPLQAWLGHTLGTMAVYTFFVISGYLIAMSYIRTSTKMRFAQARILRLLPGLVVSLVVVTLIMGPFVTTLPVMTYLTHPDTWGAIIRNATLVKLQFTLPGVFETQPYPTVQGSIWTLIYEVLCYVGVFALGILGLLQKRVAGTIILGVYIGLWVIKDALGITIHPRIDALYEMSVPFMLGTLIYLWQHKLPLSIFGVIGTIAACWLLRSTPLYEITLHIALAYTIFWLAFVPGGFIRAYNRLGDYSYGIYIYAFPAQGLAVWLYGPQTPLVNMAIALPLTVIPSILSWHYVEKPALDLRHRSKNQSVAAK